MKQEIIVLNSEDFFAKLELIVGDLVKLKLLEHPIPQKIEVPKPFYTQQELLKIFDNTKPTLYRLINKESIHPIFIYGRVYYDAEEVTEVINKFKREAGINLKDTRNTTLKKVS